MMYNNKLAVALKSAGKVLREFDDTVYLPFGCEYSILIKNLNSVRALVHVSIDGEPVDDCGGFVIDANSDLDLQRFIRNGNLNLGNRFKFIERTENVEQHRGIGVEDGLVRVEFQFEKKPVRITWDNNPWYNPCDPWDPNRYKRWGEPYIGTPLTSDNIRSVSDSYTVSNSVNVSNFVNDAGITVPGSVSDQHFTTVASFPTEDETHVIVLKLLGETEDNRRVKKAVTVKSKPKCTTCGHVNAPTAKFCTECGTSLTIV